MMAKKNYLLNLSYPYNGFSHKNLYFLNIEHLRTEMDSHWTEKFEHFLPNLASFSVTYQCLPGYHSSRVTIWPQ